MDIKAGDMVRLKPVKVSELSTYKPSVFYAEGRAGYTFVLVPEDIESVVVAPLQPGDMARWADETVEIIFIKGTDAWVERNGHPPKRLTIPLASLTRLP